MFKQLFELLQSWFRSKSLQSELYAYFQKYTKLAPELQLESFYACFPREERELISLKNKLEKSWFYFPGVQQIKRSLFIPASTVSLTPLVEIVFSILLNRKITIRVPSNLSIEFYQIFRQRAPEELRACFDFVSWQSDNLAETEDFFRRADLVSLHGNNQTISKFKNLKRTGQKLVAFGEKISFILLDLNSWQREDAFLIARDICLYKQLGCLSAQMIYFLSAERDFSYKFEELVTSLQDQIEKFERYFSQEDLLKQESLRQKLSLALSKREKFLTKNIILSQEKNYLLQRSPGLALVFLKKINSSFEELIKIRRELKDYSFLGTIGTNFSSKESLLKLQTLFPRVRICPLGQMQRPGLSWVQTPSLVLS